MMFRSVDLPEPDSPTMATYSPDSTLSDTALERRVVQGRTAQRIVRRHQRGHVRDDLFGAHPDRGVLARFGESGYGTPGLTKTLGGKSAGVANLGRGRGSVARLEQCVGRIQLDDQPAEAVRKHVVNLGCEVGSRREDIGARMLLDEFARSELGDDELATAQTREKCDDHSGLERDEAQ